MVNMSLLFWTRNLCFWTWIYYSMVQTINVNLDNYPLIALMLILTNVSITVPLSSLFPIQLPVIQLLSFLASCYSASFLFIFLFYLYFFSTNCSFILIVSFLLFVIFYSFFFTRSSLLVLFYSSFYFTFLSFLLVVVFYASLFYTYHSFILTTLLYSSFF